MKTFQFTIREHQVWLASVDVRAETEEEARRKIEALDYEASDVQEFVEISKAEVDELEATVEDER